MPRVINQFDLDMAPEQTWRIVGDLADAASWVPGVVAARVVGDLRVCTTVDGHEIRERLTAVEGEPMSYRYVHLVTPAPIHNSRGILRVRRAVWSPGRRLVLRHGPRGWSTRPLPTVDHTGQR